MFLSVAGWQWRNLCCGYRTTNTRELRCGVLSAQLSVDVIRETTNISVEEMQGWTSNGSASGTGLHAPQSFGCATIADEISVTHYLDRAPFLPVMPPGNFSTNDRFDRKPSPVGTTVPTHLQRTWLLSEFNLEQASRSPKPSSPLLPCFVLRGPCGYLLAGSIGHWDHSQGPGY